VAKATDKEYKRSIEADAKLFSMDGTNKRRKREIYDEGEFVFMASGKFWHYGVILSCKEEDVYEVHFIDNEKKSRASYEFRRIDQMKDNDLVWFSRQRNNKVDVHEEFSLFRRKIDNLNKKLKSYYDRK
jgi:hypothetical protein